MTRDFMAEIPIQEVWRADKSGNQESLAADLGEI